MAGRAGLGADPPVTGRGRAERGAAASPRPLRARGWATPGGQGLGGRWEGGAGRARAPAVAARPAPLGAASGCPERAGPDLRGAGAGEKTSCEGRAASVPAGPRRGLGPRCGESGEGSGLGGPGGRRLRPQRCLLLFKGSSHLPQQLKFTTSDSCDRIKDEFQLLQAQYHSLKLECDKLASEKSEMQRHYVMYYEMSYGLNIEMHKQAEIVKRLNGICAQVLPYLSQEHQQQVLGAIERAKQVTAPELNSIIRQQLQAHQLSQLQALALPLTPLPVGLQPPSLPAVSAGTGLLSLSALGSQAHLSKEDKNGHDGDAHQDDDGEKSD
ncbi:TLE family member 5 [Onychostruthus taczanowskii]|uniref:TLE family member 5 n=1 Tax=Onychostruthus taczanowskii TaxID=356909 RepID=UPI001B8089A1|nr:TLE family member 5 [Onychostruthus taczanowskii]